MMEEQKQPQNEPQKEPVAKPHRTRNILLILAGVLAVLVLLAGLYINGKLDLIHYNDGTVVEAGTIDADEDQDLDSTGLTQNEEEMQMPEGSPFADSDVVNILLISTDERTEAVNDWDAFTHLNQLDGTSSTTEFSNDARADSLILVSLNIVEDTIKLVSLERGTGVPILLDGWEGQYDWITHTFRYGGAKLTMDTVEACFGVQVDHYIRINFNSFVQIVDAVGGIDIDLTELEAAALNWEVPSNSMLIVNKVEPGLNHFDGYTALQYARLRKIDNDWQRVVRQRTVIQAVLDQIKSSSVTDLDNLLNTVLPLIQTNFTKTEIAAMLVQLPGFLGVQTQQMSLPAENSFGVRRGMDNREMYDPDWTVNRTILQKFLYTSMGAEEAIEAGWQTPETATEETVLPDDIVAEEEPAEEGVHTFYLVEPLEEEDLGPMGYEHYLVGVQPGQSGNAAWQNALAEQMRNEGVELLLVERGVGETLLLENYLQTGDETLLRAYLSTVPDADEQMELWRTVYRQNTEGAALHVMGIGAKQNAALAMQGLSVYLEQDTEGAPAALGKALDARDWDAAAQAFRVAMAQQSEAMQAWLGEHYPLAERIFVTLRTRTPHHGEANAEALELRDGVAFAQQCFPEMRFCAMVQPEQVWQRGVTENEQTLAMLLQADGLDLCSVLTLYAAANGPQLQPTAGSELLNAGRLWALDEVAYRPAGSSVLLALDTEGCPYAADDLLTTNAEGNLRDYAQKIVVLFDSEQKTAE